MTNLSKEEINEIKGYIVETLVDEYIYDEIVARDMVNNSSFLILLESNPDYVLHYDFGYWAEYIKNRSGFKM